MLRHLLLLSRQQEAMKGSRALRGDHGSSQAGAQGYRLLGNLGIHIISESPFHHLYDGDYESPTMQPCEE